MRGEKQHRLQVGEPRNRDPEGRPGEQVEWRLALPDSQLDERRRRIR